MIKCLTTRKGSKTSTSPYDFAHMSARTPKIRSLPQGHYKSPPSQKGVPPPICQVGSSAHVYLRLPKDATLDDVPSQLIDELAQLVKANSIQGNKMNNVDVVYTMWSNLKKTGDMEVGQVGFHKNKEVRKVHVEKRINEIINRLEKTRRCVEQPDLRAEREQRDANERAAQRASQKEAERMRRKQEDEESRRKEEERRMRSYDGVFDERKMVSNKDAAACDSDEFM